MNCECFCEIVLRKFVRDFHCLGILPESWFAHKIISLLRVRSLPVEVALLRFDRTAEAAVPMSIVVIPNEKPHFWHLRPEVGHRFLLMADS
jgi:hypothetical protein